MGHPPLAGVCTSCWQMLIRVPLEGPVARIDDRTRALLRAREALLETGGVPAGAPLRPEIATSWRRSLMSGVDPDGFEPDYDPEVSTEGQLCAAARPVIGKQCEQLAGTGTCIILADRRGRILQRWVDDPGLRRLLDGVRAEPKFTLAEPVAGTNGLGTVLESGHPVRVSGGEHFVRVFHPFTCVGVPIRHPISRQVEGVLDITCRYEDTNSLLLPWILEAARAIEQRAYLQASREERLLLERFLSAPKRPACPVFCLNDRTIIGNPAAMRLLGRVDQALLWEHAARVIADRAGNSCTLELPDGELMETRCVAVGDGHDVIGALIEIAPVRDAAPAASPSRRRPPRQPFSALAGHSTAWRLVCQQAHRFRDSRLPLLVAGEAGTGKSALVSAMFGSGMEGLDAFDAALQPAEGTGPWVRALRERVADVRGVVVIRHIEALEPRAAQAVCSVLDTAGGNGPRLVATLTTGSSTSEPYGPLADRFAVAAIELPPLRDRLEDLPDLVTSLTRRYSVTRPPQRWLPGAIQTLSRLDWPGNVRQLENIVRRVLDGRRAGDIGAADLPEDIRREAPRRRLSRLERLELRAIMAALKQTGGNKAEAAHILEISRSTLYRKMRSFGIELDKAAF